MSGAVPRNERVPFEYAVVRVVPRVERGEAMNAGVIVYSRALGFLGARWQVDRDRLVAHLGEEGRKGFPGPAALPGAVDEDDGGAHATGFA